MLVKKENVEEAKKVINISKVFITIFWYTKKKTLLNKS